MRVIFGLFSFLFVACVQSLHSRHGHAHSHRGHLRKGNGTGRHRAPAAPILAPLGGKLEKVPGLTVSEDLLSNVGSSRLLVATLLVPDAKKKFGDSAHAQYPYWLSRLYNSTLENVRQHNHSYLVRTAINQQVPKWQPQQCYDPNYVAQSEKERKSCVQYLRGHVNWEKYQMMLDNLELPSQKYSHVLALDADATFARIDRDSLRMMADEMDRLNASLFVADEDWNNPEHSGKDYINGGMVMARNTPATKRFLRTFLNAHHDPEGSGFYCWNNEQLCLRGFLKDLKGNMKFPGVEPARRGEFIYVASGMKYNRHPCALYLKEGEACPDGLKLRSKPPEGVNSTVHIVHFMGASHGWLDNPRKKNMLIGAP